MPSGRAWCALGPSQSSRYRTADRAQISAFWDAGLEPVDVAMSDLVCQHASLPSRGASRPYLFAVYPQQRSPICRTMGSEAQPCCVDACAPGGIVPARARAFLMLFRRRFGWRTAACGQADGRVTLSAFRGAVFVGGFSYADTLDSAKVRSR